jgi:hypothetical protein
LYDDKLRFAEALEKHILEEETMAESLPSPVENQLIAELAREQVAKIAPQELPLFRTTSEAYFENPERTLERASSRDEKLAFGGVEVGVAFLTPFVMPVAKEVVEFLVGEVKQYLKSESSGLIGEYVKKLFRKFRPAQEHEEMPPPLTLDQARRVRDRAYEKARELKLSEEQADLLADSLVGSLVTEAAR